MIMRSLLIEQRNTGDQFRSVERDVLRQHLILAGGNLGAAARRQAEEALSIDQAEMLRSANACLNSMSP